MYQRLLLIFALCGFCAFSGEAQQPYYWTDNGKVDLTENAQSYIVHTTETQALMTLANQRAVTGFKEVKAFPHKNYAVVYPEDVRMTDQQMLDKLSLDASSEILPGYQLEDGFTMYATHQVVFRAKFKSDLNLLRQIIDRFDYQEVTEKFGVHRVTLHSLDQVFDLGNALYESGLTEFAHPDFYAPIERNADPLFGQQFQMHNTGQTIDGVTGTNDMDCNALEAWGVTLGSASITVAVIDDGLETHEDLRDGSNNSRIIGGYTPANNGNGGTTSSSDHGVACAGIVAASHNNIGVQGVAPLAQLLSVNIFYGGESTQDIADGITWAKNNGADVMSNSWGYTSCSVSYSNINNAISDATNNGRGGLGCVVVFASGNGYKSCVDFPANNSNVIAVGAFTNQGVRSNYSNYGSALDIVAPSNAVSPQPGAGVRTTDRQGGAGYSSGNYTTTFGGTSAACPVVAGVAALVLGYNASLSQADVKNILYSTAIDMGPSGFDNEYANGRVNAFAALNAAGGNPPTCTDGVQNGQETGVDCGGPDCAPCPSGCNDNELTLTINLDNYPEETSWNITTDPGGTVVASGGTYGSQPDGSTVIEDICLTDGCYTFTIFDSYGDGICCSYGVGSYSLTEGGTVIASGGSFGSSEATPFCLGGGGPDTDPPSTPTNLTASNTTQTSTDLDWNASTDNVGVDGYNVYVDGNLDGTTTGTSYTVNGLSPATTYTMSVSAFDAAGNESGSASVNVTTEAEQSGGEIFAHYFETGWDGWQDGGSDCFRYSGGRSWEGSYSIRIRDNSGTASSMTSSVYNLSGFSSVELKFYFYPNSMENGEDFWVRYNNGSGWQTVAVYTSGSSFSNNSFYVATVTLDDATYNLTSNSRFRFQCDASSNADRVYIDEVTLNAFGTSAASIAGNTIEMLPGQADGVTDFDEDEIRIAPNPTRDRITVTSEDVMQQVEVIGVDGRSILIQDVDGHETQIQLSNLQSGIYFVRITTEEEKITERIVKQ